MMKIYSNSFQSALKYLKDNEANIRNLLIMSSEFNIRDNLQDSLYPHYLSHSDDLFIITDSFNLGLFTPTNQVSTRYSNNCQDINLVLDLMFLCFRLYELNNHTIHPEWRLISDYTCLMVTILIVEEHIQTKKHTIVKDSEEEHTFIKELIKVIRNIDINNISDVNCLDNTVHNFASSMENIQVKNLKVVNIMKYSKSWWDAKCSRDLDKYSVVATTRHKVQ